MATLFPAATVTNISSFTPAQQAAFNSAAALSGGRATSTTDPTKAVNAPIPTTAPTGQTSTSSPTPVNSSQGASNYVDGTIAPALSQAQGAMATAQENKAAAAAAPPPPPPPPPAPAAPSTAAQDALKQVTETPEIGHHFLYKADGSRVEVPMAVTAASLGGGYSEVNPTAPKVAPTTPEVASSTDSVGNMYKKYSDGTYGKFDPTGVYKGPAQIQDFTTAQHGQAIFDSLNSALNGTYPLTASQQTQVDGLKAQFQQLIKSQETANANYTGGMTVAQNLYGMGNSLTGLGEIKGTVDAGISKIADLNSKMGTAVSQMEQAFQDNNIKNLQGAYSLYSQSVKERQDELDKIQAATQKAIVDQRNDARAQEQLRLTALMDDHTIDYQNKQNEMAQSTLSDREKQQIVDNQHTALKDALDQKNSDRTYNLALRKENREQQAVANAVAVNNAFSNLPSVSYTPSGSLDAAAQQKLLNALPGGPDGLLATKVKGIANYTMKPTDFAVSAKKGVAQYTRDNLIALATKYDPHYDDNKFDTRHDTLTDYDPKGKSGKIATSLNMAMQHLADISDSAAAVHNSSFTPYNAVANAVSSRLGSGSQAAAQANLAASIGELATVFKGTPGTDQEIKNLEVLNVNSSPDQVKAVVAEELKLVGARLNALNDSYVGAMGKQPDSPLVKPTTTSYLSRLSRAGYSVDVPGFNAEATSALDSIVGSSSSGATTSSPLDSIGSSFGIK